MSEFLECYNKERSCYVISKRLDRCINKYYFRIQINKKFSLDITAEEVFKTKELLNNLNINDIYDIAYTHGMESIIKEQSEIMALKTIQ